MTYFKKIFLLVIITTIIACGIMLSTTLIRIGHEMKNVVESTLTTSADQKSKLFNAYVGDMHSLTTSLADDIQIKEFFINLENSYEDTNYKNLIRENLKLELESHGDILESLFYVYDGKVYIDGLFPEAEGFDITNQDWYGKTLETKEGFIAEAKFSPITGLPVMGSNYPILDDDGNVMGIFVLTINLEGFSKIVVENNNDPNQKTLIVNADGLVILSEEENQIGQYDISTKIPELYETIINNKEGIVYYSVLGEEYIAAVTKSDYDIYIIQSMPVNAYNDSMTTSFFNSVLILLGVIFISVIVTLRFARTVTLPVELLVDEMNEMTSGNYEGVVPDKLKNRKDEFGKLGEAVIKMKRETLSLIMDLKASNEEIEASLEEVLQAEDGLRAQNMLLKESEEKLKASEENNRAIINALPDIVFIISDEGTFIDCQVSDENQLLIPKELFIGKEIKDILPPNIAKSGYEAIEKVLETGKLQSFEYSLEVGEEEQIYELRIVKSHEKSVLAISRNITEQKKYLERIEFLSFHDQLTGLFNRRFFEEELERLDVPENLPLCVLIADVNGLKLINDSFGHKIGDELLKKSAEILQKSCVKNETVSRIGGDEFIILIPKMQIKEVEKLVKRIKTNCESEKVSSVSVSLSVGWEVKYSQDEDILEIFNKAEDHMYRRKLYESPSMRGKTITAIINTLYEKNKREENHSRRVSALCVSLAEAYGFQEGEVDEIKTAGLLHDIGKIAVQETFLNKPGKLTKEEFDEVARHPEIGYRILGAVHDMSDIAEYVLYHHERWDGKGYPSGKSGEDINIQSRMISIADAYDAMTSERTYRSPFTKEEAADEILRNAGTQFDPELAKLFVEKVLNS